MVADYWPIPKRFEYLNVATRSVNNWPAWKKELAGLPTWNTKTNEGDTNKIKIACESFSEKMLERMKQKQQQGFTGWDWPAFAACYVPETLHDKTIDVLMKGELCDPKDLVDIANLAMILHYRLNLG